MPTQLYSIIKNLIKSNGPINVAQFIQLALTHPHHGYYTCKNNVIGGNGDFITSPEISQIFGEIVAIKIASWYAERQIKEPLHLVELGPGKGTLISDILRTFNALKRPLIRNCSLLEVSDVMKQSQREKLEEFQIQTNWYSIFDKLIDDGNFSETTPVIIAHEFFDALPIRTFKRAKENLWHEVMISKNVNSRLQFEVSSQPSFVQFSPLLKPVFENYTGDILEVSPETIRICGKLASFLGNFKNAFVFIVDYAQKANYKGSLRAIKDHKILDDVFEEVGACDITADVDFSALKSIFSDGLKTEVIFQGDFLLRNGIRERSLELIRRNRADSDVCKQVIDAYERRKINLEKQGPEFFPLFN